MGRHINEIPKSHILGWKDVIWRTDRQNRSTDATCARDKETKIRQRKKANVQLKTAYLPRPPTSSDRNEILHGRWSSGSSSKVHISSILSSFVAVGVKICPSPLTWPLAYTTACTTIQAVITCSWRLVGWQKFNGAFNTISNADVQNTDIRYPMWVVTMWLTFVH